MSNSMNSLTEYLISSVSTEEVNFFIKRLVEGGAFGHLSHPYEDLTLTFSDIKDIVNAALSGKIEAEEKIDGQNLMFTWKDGVLRAARNKGHLKNYGENSLTKEQLDSMFADRSPQVREAFVSAMSDMESALSRINEDTLNKVFQNGKRFMNVEVILPETQNVIPYGLNILVFHGTIEYDENGNPIGHGMENAGKFLESIINRVSANVQKNFTLRGPNKVVLNQVKNFKQKRSEYNAQISKLQRSLSDSSTLTDYHYRIWTAMIRKKGMEVGYQIPDEIVNDIFKRWVLQDKSKNILQLKKEITSEPFRQWITQFNGKPSTSFFKQVNEPFETLFLRLGVDVLENASGYLSNSPNDAAKKIAQQTSQEIEKIKQSNDPNAMARLENELRRIQSMGGLDKLSGTEGVVFYRNGKAYKLTGLFAGVNQILGIIRYKK